MKKKTGRRITAIIAVVLVMSIAFATTAFALSSTFTWLSGTYPTKNESLGSMNPSNGIKFAGVATSAESCTFTVKLQKQGWFGTWSDVGNTYTITSDSVTRYDSRQGCYVQGQPFLLVWPTTDNATYRLHFEVQSNPQVVGFTAASAYTW